jgi:NTE family protein
MKKRVTMPRSQQTRRKPLNLALQGGGSHGALTWGVLDRLLEDDRLAIRAISGTSAGAMNAVALADGTAPAKACTPCGRRSAIRRAFRRCSAARLTG